MRTNRMTGLSLALVGLSLLAGRAAGQAMGSMGSMDHAKSLRGAFAGVGGRKATGSYEIVTKDGRQVLELSKDFSIGEESEASVVLSGAVDGRALNLGRLPHAMGVATFTLPAGTNLSDYHRVVIWSKQLGTALAEAPLGGGSGTGMMHDAMGHQD